MSKTACLAYDPTEFIDTEDDVVAYLNAAVDDGDPQLVIHAIKVIARVRKASLKPGAAVSVDLDAVERAVAGPGPVELANALVAIKALGVKLQVARY
ncbi:MAG: transcriptional regulator [Pseudomonadota bacterium]